MRDRALGSTIRLMFNSTNPDGGGAPVAPSAAFTTADIAIYKDGSATQKTSTNGMTVTSPFDSITGLHLLEIDTSNNTGDTGFWASGSSYSVRLVTAKTVATYVISGLSIGEFSLELQTADVRKIGGDGQSATDLKDFADEGYDPATNKLTGAVELDSTAIAAVADAVLTESILDHRNVANSLAKYIWQIRQANLTIDGTVSNAITPTTLTFSSNISATTSAYAHAVLLFTTGPLEGENSPIISYNNTNGVFLLEEPLTAAPSDGDEFVVIAGSHVHSVADIQDGLARTGADGDTLETLSDQIDGIGGGSGTGARTVTITVNDGANALQNATVRVTEGANTFTALTNVSGVAVFNLDDATYTVGITKGGYTFAGTMLVVDGTESATYSMTAVNFTPPTNPDLSAVVVLCLGTDFEPEVGITIDLRIKTLPSGSSNTAYPGMKQTATSNGSGVATLEAPKGSVCEWKRGKEDAWTEITIGSGEQTNVTSIIGSRY